MAMTVWGNAARSRGAVGGSEGGGKVQWDTGKFMACDFSEERAVVAARRWRCLRARCRPWALVDR